MLVGGLKDLLSRSSQVQLQQIAGAKRGPARYLGFTKSQWLDKLMRSNANICFSITMMFFPICAYYTHRYMTVIKPAREELARQQTEELLSEGKAVS